MKAGEANKTLGDQDTFIKSWHEREEKFYTHWTREEPRNQVQLAFRNHWEVFQELLKDKSFNEGKRFLEVGAGRGNISAYFSDAGYDCTLLDISSEIMDIAEQLFKKNGLKAKFKVGDVNELPFDDNSLDIIVSIGLLEHFEDIENPIKEQIRVLDKGGIFLGYVVPKYTENVQKEYDWINDILRGYYEAYNDNDEKVGSVTKDTLYRSDLPSDGYIKVMKKHGLDNVHATGIYSLPMISHSINFPFSLMPAESEKALVGHFQKVLNERKKKSNTHPWLCPEGYGQAFLVYGFKK